MKIILQNERPISWNIFYSGKHWSKRAKDTQYFHSLFAGEKTLQRNRPVKLVFPVKIIITAYMSKHLMDPDNICAKVIIDGLKPWLLPDDTYRYIDSVMTKVIKEEKEPRIEIDII